MPASGLNGVKVQPYQVFMLALCLYALGALTADSFFSLDPSTRTILEYTDNAVCGLFFLDFVISLIRAPSRWQYLCTLGAGLTLRRVSPVLTRCGGVVQLVSSAFFACCVESAPPSFSRLSSWRDAPKEPSWLPL